MINEIDAVHKALDRIKRLTSKGGEYWTARNIQAVLGYSTWEGFTDVIGRAEKACESTNHNVPDHFRHTSKMVPIGSGAEREQDDVYLDRYACYLIAMNGDSNKPQIATAQTYFAVQTRRMEITDQALEDQNRVHLRKRVSDANKALQAAAKNAGVVKYGVFNDAGYRGLYGGLRLQDIKRRKRIPEEQNLLDRAGRAELAANEFRITQAEQKIMNEKVQGETLAIITHKEVGEKVRATIGQIGGTMPEDLPSEPHIKEVQKRLKGKPKKKLSSPPTK